MQPCSGAKPQGSKPSFSSSNSNKGASLPENGFGPRGFLPRCFGLTSVKGSGGAEILPGGCEIAGIAADLLGRHSGCEQCRTKPEPVGTGVPIGLHVVRLDAADRHDESVFRQYGPPCFHDS